METPPIRISPLPFASKVKNSFVPDEIAARATPLPAAAAVIFRPVVLEAVLVSTWRA